MSKITTSIAIPYLKAGESIIEWAKTYTSATAMLDEAQQIALLPVYVNRSLGEREIARVAATKDTLKAAIDELEVLIDGTSSVISHTKMFFEKEPRSSEAHEITACYFEMKVLADKAKIPKAVVLKRFLTFFKQGDAFYKDNAAKIDKADGADLTDAEVLALVKLVQPKYRKVGQESSEMMGVMIKEEVLKLDELKQELSEVREELYHMRKANEENYESEEDEVLKLGHRAPGNDNPGYRNKPCSHCGMYNHVSEKCYKGPGNKDKTAPKTTPRYNRDPCSICGMENHTASRCFRRFNKDRPKTA